MKIIRDCLTLDFYHKAFISTLGLVLAGIGAFVAWNVLDVQRDAQDKRIQKLEDFNERLLRQQATLEAETRRNAKRDADSFQRAANLYEKTRQLQERTELVSAEVLSDLYWGNKVISDVFTSPRVSAKLLAQLEAKLSHSPDEQKLLTLINQISEARFKVQDAILKYSKESQESEAKLRREHDDKEAQFAANRNDTDTNLKRLERNNELMKRISNENRHIKARWAIDIGMKTEAVRKLVNQQNDVAKSLGILTD
jgi:hypothetical protein